jgi:pyruvate kinase
VNKIKIICTVGPSSLSSEVLKKWVIRGVDLFRINLSHTKLEDVENTILQLKENNVTVCLDTEGSQIRTGFLGKEYVLLHENNIIRLYSKEIICDETKIYIRPLEAVSSLSVGDIISLDFNSAMIKVVDVSPLKENGYILCSVLNGGIIGNNKGVDIINKIIKLPAYSEKDKYAISLGEKYGVKYYTLSFMDTKNDVLEFKTMCSDCRIYSKIETRAGVENLEDIMAVSDGILIDRGDLSREIPIEKIPMIQKIIIKKCIQSSKDVFVATHILDSMCTNVKPSRSEVNDIINTLLDGATGIVLTKESAIGKYPVQTVNMLVSLKDHVNKAMLSTKKEINGFSNYLKSPLKEIDYLRSFDFLGLLNEPHGGKLIDRTMFHPASEEKYYMIPTLKVDYETLMEVEQIAIGAYSPLEGFMDLENMESVLNRMRLKNGIVWTIPIVLMVNHNEANIVKEGEDILLVGPDGVGYAVLHLIQKYSYDKDLYCEKLYGTKNHKHPGVSKILNSGDIFLAGKISLLRTIPSNMKQFLLTPYQARKIFEEKGWSKVIGFHTRNVIHRSHEFIQLEALEMSGCDGLFIHPVIGLKKKGDFQSHIIIRSYEIMIDKFYPKNRVVLGAFASKSYYAGPREAIFTAICRKNYGCSHFIVGRDHTGVNGFYGEYDSHHIFDKFPDLGIIPVKFNKVSYSKKNGYYFDSSYSKTNNNEVGHRISGTELRQMFEKGEKPPSTMMRDEISEMIQKELIAKNPVFVE